MADGRLCNDLDGNYTFMSSRGSSVTDFLILSKYDTNLLHDFRILDFSIFSDHAPIYFTFLTKDIAKKTTIDKTKTNFHQIISFDEEKVSDYKESLEQNINDLESIIYPETDVNMHAEILSNFIYDHAL